MRKALHCPAQNAKSVCGTRVKSSLYSAGVSLCRGYAGVSEGKSVHFGFETVTEEEKAEKGEMERERVYYCFFFKLNV